MAKKLYVGNLPFNCADAELAQVFEQFGHVASARVITDRDTGRSKGFGFVEMDDDEASDQAIKELHGKIFMGRPLTVNEARPREERAPREGGERRGGGGGFYRNGGGRGEGGGGFGGGGGGGRRRDQGDW